MHLVSIIYKSVDYLALMSRNLIKTRLPSKQNKGILSWRLLQSQWYPAQNKTRQTSFPQLLQHCSYNCSQGAITCSRGNTLSSTPRFSHYLLSCPGLGSPVQVHHGLRRHVQLLKLSFSSTTFLKYVFIFSDLSIYIYIHIYIYFFFRVM